MFLMNVKILIAYHKSDAILADDVLLPIHLGRAIARKEAENDKSKAEELELMSESMIGDDEGENISLKNKTFNEMTAVYWAWKNYDKLGNPDFLGLMHYRRHFVFSENGKAYNEVTKIDEKYLDKISYSKENVEDILSNHDFIVASPQKRVSVYKHYANAHDVHELDLALEILKARHPDYATAADNYINGEKCYFYNMFVFPREIFFRYAEWMFDILFHYEKQLNDETKRMFVSERLTGIFITKLIEEGLKPAQLPTMFVSGLKPTFKQAVKQSKLNLKKAREEKRGFMNKIYALKPIILFFLPTPLAKAYRNRKTV